MKRLNMLFWSLTCLLFMGFLTIQAQEKKAGPQRPDPNAIYTLGDDSKRHVGVPQGKLTESRTHKSKIFANTERDFAVYIPVQYDKSNPCRVMVFQDGRAYANFRDQSALARVTVVLDNLINKKELPPIIAIFIQPGVPLESDGSRVTDRGRISAQRSLEYDTLSPKYAEFLEKEMLPRVAKDFELNLTRDPEERAICGMSSGGICAFTVAWERPDLFRKVLSHIGSFTNIRGGHVYPALIRKSNPNAKPIRVFLQAGLNDLDNEAGSWPLGNQEMAAALKFRKFDYRFELGVGSHTLHHGGAILPESLKWLWRESDRKSDDGKAEPKK